MATAAKFRGLQLRVRRAFDDATAQLAAGSIDVDDWGDLVADLLAEAHAEAWSFGRQRAIGGAAGITADDAFIGRGIADIEASDYLPGFLDAIDNGSYDTDDGLAVNKIKQRLDLYVARLRGTANEAFVLTSPPLTQFAWQLGIAEHCDDCRDLAANNPYLPQTLWTFPGAGDTVCLTKCKCKLVRLRDGQAGF